MKSAAKKAPTPSIVALPLEELSPRPGNRDLTRDTALDELAESMRLIGQLHPIHVRPRDGGGYEILAGVRRWMAATHNKAATIDALVHEGCDDTVADEIRFHENSHRAEPTALDVARALQRIKNVNAYTHEEVAQHVALALPRVKLYLSIFTASDELLTAADKHALPITLVVALKRYESEAGVPAMRRALKHVVAGDYTLRDVVALRRRRRGGDGQHGGRSRTKATPWARVESRVRSLAKADRSAIVAQLRSLLADLETAKTEPGPARAAK